MGATPGHPDSRVRAPYVTWACPTWDWLSCEEMLRPRVGCSLSPAGFWEVTLCLPQACDLWPGDHSLFPKAAKGQGKGGKLP